MSEQRGAALVPDSIEPIVGYKYLTIKPTGKERFPLLHSPYFGGGVHMAWPATEPAVAECNRTHHVDTVWKLQALKKPPRDRRWSHLEEEHGLPPQVQLGVGLDWYWVAEEHAPPMENCSCGIYAVSTPKAARGYAGPHKVLVRVAQWGKTVPASDGARSEFACVTGILSSTCPSWPTEVLAEKYGVERIDNGQFIDWQERAAQLLDVLDSCVEDLNEGQLKLLYERLKPIVQEFDV